MKLYLHCPTGISGDMFLAAMADSGLDLSPLSDIFAQAGLEVEVLAEKGSKNNFQGSYLRVSYPKEQPLRHLKDILFLVEKLPLEAEIKEKTERAFQRLATAESQIHGMNKDEVHFHEIGAVDTLIDIVGGFWALNKLAVEAVYCSKLPWFQGYVNCQHGRLPLPAPATVLLLQDKPVYPTDFETELITPTGALLVDQMVKEFVSGPQGKVQFTGIGWGNKDLGSVPNGLRAFFYSDSEERTEQVWLLETNIDHLTGEEIGSLFDNLFESGALDVLYLPGIMKKNRAGGLLQVLSTEERLIEVQKEFFKNSLTLGVRRQKIERVVLARRPKRVNTCYGELEAKEIDLGGQKIKRPEYESLKRLAKKTGRSVVELRYLLGQESETDDK